MGDEGSCPRLGLILLSSVVVSVASSVLTCLSLLTCPYERAPGGFYRPSPRGTMVMLQVGGSVLSVSENLG